MNHEGQRNAAIALMLQDAGKNAKPVLSKAQAFNAEVLAQSEKRRDEANDNARAMMREASQRR